MYIICILYMYTDCCFISQVPTKNMGNHHSFFPPLISPRKTGEAGEVQGARVMRYHGSHDGEILGNLVNLIFRGWIMMNMDMD